MELGRAVPEARLRIVLVASGDAALGQRMRDAAAEVENLELLGPVRAPS